MDQEPRAAQGLPHQRRRRRIIGWLDLRRILLRTLQDSMTDRASLAAAGCAFYGTLALFPAMSMLLSVYGLVFDPVSVEPQLHLLSSLLPPPAYALIEDRVHELISQPHAQLSISLIVSFVVTFWSAATGSKSLLSAVNVAYDVTEQRTFLHFQLVGLAMTLVAVVCAVLTIAVLLGLRPAIALLGLSGQGAGLAHFTSLLLLVIFFAVAIGLLYRFGPARTPPPRTSIMTGTLTATALWLIASELLSLYVSNMTGFGATYGSIGAVVGVMMWFYVSAYAVVLGAELNACLEEFLAGN
ncbi:MAG: YihY/virulence factor BrkB family protein [Acetobacteraceae bacterium]